MRGHLFHAKGVINNHFELGEAIWMIILIPRKIFQGYLPDAEAKLITDDTPVTEIDQ